MMRLSEEYRQITNLHPQPQSRNPPLWKSAIIVYLFLQMQKQSSSKRRERKR